MRTTMTVASVALVGTALGALTYTAVSAPPSAELAAAVPATSTREQGTGCGKPDRMVGDVCATVVHVRRNNGSAQAATAQAASSAVASPAPAAPAPASPAPVPAAPVADFGGEDFDEEGGEEAEDRAEDRADEAEDRAEDRADEAEDRAEDRADESGDDD